MSACLSVPRGGGGSAAAAAQLVELRVQLQFRQPQHFGATRPVTRILQDARSPFRLTGGERPEARYPTLPGHGSQCCCDTSRPPSSCTARSLLKSADVQPEIRSEHE